MKQTKNLVKELLNDFAEVKGTENKATEIKSSNDLRHTINTTWKGNPMEIKIRLNDECNNGHQDFSITATVWEKGKPRNDRNMLMGGCCHEAILQAKPSLKQFVSLHLCDYKGIPMHAGANGFYFLRNGFNNTKIDNPLFPAEYCEYYRISKEQFAELQKTENVLQFSIALKELGILAQWEAEAKKAIEELERLTGTKFIIDSKRTQFVEPTEEELQEEAKKQASGYYTEAAREERKEAKKQAAFTKLRAEFEAATQKAEIEYLAKYAILEAGGEEVLKNCIYYSHSKEIAFNWKGYDQLSQETIDHVKKVAKLPEGVTYSTKER